MLSKTRYVPFAVYLILTLAAPYLYNQRLTSGVFKNDFYSLWLAGSLCWLYAAPWRGGKADAVTIALTCGCAFVLFESVRNGFPNESSTYALVTFLSCIGIVRYLITLSSKHFFVVVLVISVACLSEVCFAAAQGAKGDWESMSLRAHFGNSGFFANYLGSMMPLFLAGFLNKAATKRWLRIYFLGTFMITAAMVVFTTARAALLGSLIGSFITAMFFLGTISRRQWTGISISCALLLVVGVVGLYHLRTDSALGRLTIYRVSCNIIQDYPLFGVGTNRFATVYNNYQAQYFSKNFPPVQKELLAEDTYEAFNSIIQIAAEYGLLGLLLAVWIGFTLYKYISYNQNAVENKWLRIAAIGCLISVAVSSLFSNPFHNTPLLLILPLYFAAALRRGEQPASSLPLPTTRKVIVLPIVAGLIFYIVTRTRAELAWHSAAETAKYGNFTSAEKLYRQAYPLLKYNGDFLFNFGAEATLASEHHLAINLLKRSAMYSSTSSTFLFLGRSYEATDQFALAEQNYLHAIYTVPSRITPKYHLIKLYRRWGRESDADHWIGKTLSYPIKVPSDLTTELIREIEAFKKPR